MPHCAAEFRFVRESRQSHQRHWWVNSIIEPPFPCWNGGFFFAFLFPFICDFAIYPPCFKMTRHGAVFGGMGVRIHSSGGRDGDSHRRHAHAHGRRLDRAIPATGIIIREAFDCEARRCEGLSRQALTGGPRWWPPRRLRGCWRARRSPRGRSRPRRRRGGRARSGGLRRARSGRSRL